MSIIEKAVDKLRGEGAAVKSDDLQEDGADSISQVDGFEPPSIQSKINTSPSQVADSLAVKSDSNVTNKPDISIGALNLEGIITGQSMRTRLAEEMRMIKRPILLNAFGKENAAKEHANLVMVTSSVAGEGKTFTALNLALSIATEMNRTILLVDADLARPSLSRILKISDRKGLTDYLVEERTNIGDLLLHTDVPTLTVLPAGRLQGHSTELLASNSMLNLFDEFAARYPDRIVLFDSPPLTVTSEAAVLASVMGQIILVVESARTPQYLVEEALMQLDSTDNVSLILNKCKKNIFSTRMAGYGYGYGYKYGSEGDR